MFKVGWTAIGLVLFPLRLAGQWHVATSKDAMTDKTSWTISTFSVAGSDSPATLRWTCDDNEMLTYVVLSEYLSGDDGVPVQYRFDAKPASEVEDWVLSDGAVVAPAWAVATLTSSAKTASKLLLRVTGSRETVTYTFDLDGWSHTPPTCTPAPCPPMVSRRLGRPRPDSLTFAAAFGKLPCQVPSAQDRRGGEGFGVVPSADQVFLEAVVEERPERLTGPAPQYPDLLRQAGVQGRVVVQGVIDTTGRVIASTVRIVQTPHPGFEDAARRVMVQSLYRPGRIGGRAVKVLVSLPVDFTIKK